MWPGTGDYNVTENFLRTIFTNTLMPNVTCQWTLCAITVVPGRIMAVGSEGCSTEVLAIIGLANVDTVTVCDTIFNTFIGKLEVYVAYHIELYYRLSKLHKISFIKNTLQGVLSKTLLN